MKKFLVAVAFGLMAIAAQAEATFDQIQGLIEQHQYQAAASGLEGIIQNHPKSAKAFYAMAQAQAGLGNLEKAQKALNIATGLNPTLDFAPASSVASLKQAITPQVAKIETIEESHFWRNFFMGFILFAGGGLIIALYMQKQRKEEEAELSEKLAAQAARQEREAEARRMTREREEERQRQAEEQAAKEKAAEDALKAHKNYGKAGFDPANPDKLKTKKQLKDEADQAAEKQRLFFEAEAKREAQARADAAEARGRNYHTPAQSVAQPAPSTTVVNNSGGNDMLTGIMIGNMLSNSGHHHDTERTVIRETVREVPAKDSSWDDTPVKAAKSSWDDDSSSKSSSSWSSSSSSSSSSWDSGSSSSSDSGSSSSWD